MEHRACGASGFGQGIDDTCLDCEIERRERDAAADIRVRKALGMLDVQMAIARAANVCLPDVRRVLVEIKE